MNIQYLYPGGRQKALTMSYDDGAVHDARLIEIFNKYHIKATFHLISGRIQASDSWIKPQELKTVYAGHEISAHSLNHPFFDAIPREQLLYEMIEDKKFLESACGYPVRGMSYPNGVVNEDVMNCIKACGFVYARTAGSTEEFKLPADFMMWEGTCHHSHDIIGKIDLFRDSWYGKFGTPLFYIWGHSFELARNTANNSWAMIEEFCDKFTATFEDKVWYATNIEIYDYLSGLRRMQFSADRTMVFSDCAQSLWISVDGEPVEIKPGLNRLV